MFDYRKFQVVEVGENGPWGG